MKMTQPDVQEFLASVARGEYGPCVPLEQVRAIYQEGFARGWLAGQARMNARAAQEMIALGVEREVVEAVMLLAIEDAPEPQP